MTGEAIGNGVLDQKFRRLFRMVDADGHGSIDRNDMLAMAGRLNARFRMDAASTRGQEVREAFDQFWTGIEIAAGTEEGERLDEGRYVAALKVAFADQAAIDGLLEPFADAVFAVCDADGDGVINEAEFQAAEAAMGAAQYEIDAAFEAIDSDGDGEVSRDEVLAAVREYYTSDDPAGESPARLLT